jgi:hypothetical protein
MSEETRRHEVTKKAVVYKMAGAEAVTIRRDVEYRRTDAGILTMDIYYPPEAKSGARTPAVLFVAGYPDPGMKRFLGCTLKEMESYVSWGRLAGASGLVAVTYENTEPVADCYAALRYLRQNAASLAIDEKRIGVWACSGNVPMALSVLMEDAPGNLKCAVLCYGLMLDLDGSTAVADAAKQWGFVNPSAGRPVDDLPRDMPLFIARAGQDENPNLNETIDRFLIKALAHNLPVTFANHAAAPHAFDIRHDSETSREIIRQILAFMRFHLGAGAAASDL